MTSLHENSRGVDRVIGAVQTLEGAGVPVHRAFPTPSLDDLDPFLLLDQMGPMDLKPGEATGFPNHPHRGFETVTYVLEGQMEHRDSHGNHGIIGPGDVQWMTAGSGLVHSEMPGSELVRAGGRLHGFQLWVNLPRRNKMAPPRYQELPGAKIPEGQTASGDVKVKVVAGEALGVKASIDTHTPILYLHFTLQPGAWHVQPVLRQYNAFAYVVAGEAALGKRAAPVGEGQFAVFAKDGQSVTLVNPAGSGRPLSVLLIAGQPLGEPVARYGPFVMNTREEIYQAYEDYRAGRMGSIQAA